MVFFLYVQMFVQVFFLDLRFFVIENDIKIGIN